MSYSWCHILEVAARTHNNRKQDWQFGLEAEEGWLAIIFSVQTRDGGHAEEAVVIVAQPAVLGEQGVVDGAEGRKRASGVGKVVVLAVRADLIDGCLCRSRGSGDLVVHDEVMGGESTGGQGDLFQQVQQ